MAKSEDQWDRENKERLERLVGHGVTKTPQGYIVGDLKKGAAMKIGVEMIRFTVYYDGQEIAHGDGVIRPERHGEWLYDCIYAVMGQIEAARRAEEAGLHFTPAPIPASDPMEPKWAAWNKEINRAINNFDPGDVDLMNGDTWAIGQPEEDAPSFMLASNLLGYTMYMVGVEVRSVVAPLEDNDALEDYYSDLLHLLEAAKVIKDAIMFQDHELLNGAVPYVGAPGPNDTP